MKSEWKTALLGDVITLKRGYDLPSKKRISGEIPIFSSSGISGTNDKPMCTPPGVITGRYGTIGQVFFSTTPYWPLNTTLYVEDFKGNIPKFIYYFLKTIHWEQFSGKSAVPGVNRNDVHRLEVEWPPIKEQERIAAILTSLDDKIELNRKINENLERQVQAIYTSIFQENANPTWQQGHLSDFVIVKYGKDHKKLADGSYPVFGSGGVMRYVERSLYDKESVLIPRKGTLNNVMYVNEPFWSVDTMFYTEMKLPNIAKFVYHFVKSKDLVSMNAGSAVPSMTTDILNAMELAIPDTDTLANFENLVAPMYLMMEESNKQARKLSTIRDILLPKLMAGKIDVFNITF